MTTLPDRLRADLKVAMRAQDRDAVKVLRTVLAAIANAEAQPSDQAVTSSLSEGPIAGAVDGLGAAEVARRELSAEDVHAIVVAERDDLLASADLMTANGAVEEAGALRGAALFLEQYLG